MSVYINYDLSSNYIENILGMESRFIMYLELRTVLKQFNSPFQDLKLRALLQIQGEGTGIRPKAEVAQPRPLKSNQFQ